jgi:hypothetical protein
MKKIIYFFILFTFSTVFSQTITGVVLDINNEPLLGATVYFDGTSFGTTTNIDGKFALRLNTKISAPLVISFIGFNKIYLNDVDYNKRYKFILVESTETLNEVKVFNNKFSRSQMMAVFKKQFLGTTKGGKKATIENEEEIYFSYDNDNFILKAYADKPLIINNPYLGYKLHYDLMSFEAKFFKYSIANSVVFSSIYVGTSRFEDVENNKKTIKNRENTFEGSFLQFFRNFANMNWGKDKFLLFNKGFQDNPNTHFTTKDTLNITQVFIKPQDRGLRKKDFIAEFSLLYNNREQSKIIFHTDNFIIDKFGLFSNYDKIYFSGALSEKKIGDLLPSDYGIEE